jgi:hypothetical protein
MGPFPIFGSRADSRAIVSFTLGMISVPVRCAAKAVSFAAMAVSFSAMTASCAASPPPAPAAPAAMDAGAAADPPTVSAKGTSTPTDEPANAIPTQCEDPSAPMCTPPGEFVDRLCDKTFQDATLALFAHGTPFTRGYLRGKLDELAWEEEVLIVRVHAPAKGGIIVGSNLGTYDVLRWDGTCSRAVEAEMVTRTRPSRPKTARIRWHRIGAKMQDALVAASDAIKRARAKRGKECKGVMTGEVSSGCDAADGVLTSAVVDYVRSGGTLPPPDNLP